VSVPRGEKRADYSDSSVDDDEDDETEARDDDQEECRRCRHKFSRGSANEPPRWNAVTQENQRAFKQSKVDILVATKGFGMGIDKGSVRFVVHTSMSAGVASWYQEAGRAGRDEEHAHVVLISDIPNEPCLADLRSQAGTKRPPCDWLKGCPYGKAALCDYGKQHQFIRKSYAGAEADALRALRMLDRIILAAADGRVRSYLPIHASHSKLAKDELSLYRLMCLGIVKDYQVEYTSARGRRGPPSPLFRVKCALEGDAFEERSREKVKRYLRHTSERFKQAAKTGSEDEVLASWGQKYQPLERHKQKLRALDTYREHQNVFEIVYRHLLLILDHTYEEVVRMRYDMLYNLLSVCTTSKCRRVALPRILRDRGVARGLLLQLLR
jgi:ATP-dependent DNA helicase RecQ